MIKAFNLINNLELKSDDGKIFLIGYISTIDEDKSGDIVTLEAQNSMLFQIKNQVITMDLDHETWRDNETGKVREVASHKIPVAKIIDARVDNKGTFVKAELNQSHPLFENIFKSIKDGFLNSFSIAYKITDFVKTEVKGKIKTLINGLNLLNVAITGTPVNEKATFNMSLKSQLVKKMESEKITEEFTKLKSENEEMKKSLSEMKSKIEALETKSNEPDNSGSKEKANDDGKKDESAETSNDMKSVLSELKEMKSEFKSLKEAPLFKSQATPSQVPTTANLNLFNLAGGGQ